MKLQNKIHLYDKIIGHIIKKGNKSLANKILFKIFIELKNKNYNNLHAFINESVINVQPKVILKLKKISGIKYKIPKPLNDFESYNIGCKWIVDSCKKKTGDTFYLKLFLELISSHQKKGLTINKKK